MNAVTEESTLERAVIACTHHCRDTDAFIQSHILAIIVVKAIVDVIYESLPIVISGDDVWIAHRSCTVEGLSHIVCAFEENAVSVCCQHTVFRLKDAEVDRSSGGCSIYKPTLFRSQCFGIVAVVDCWAASSQESDSVSDG